MDQIMFERPCRNSRLRRILLSASLGLACAVPAGAASVGLPPVMDPPSQERHPGKAIFFQLVTPDMAAAKQFYAGLFGWSFRDVPGTRSPYAEAMLGARPVAGVVQHPLPQGAHRASAWLEFFSAPDVDATVKSATEHGASVMAPPHDVPGRGREAVLADPQGAVFAVLASSSGDTPDVLSPVGDWIWRSLITRDAVADADFYHTVFGLQTYALPSTSGEPHILLASDSYARATANNFPGNATDGHAHWLSFVRVDSASDSAAKAVSLGGRVLLTPRPDRHGGMIAVVADPVGGAVGLFEWGDTESKAIAK